jgi:hypothetical protein
LIFKILKFGLKYKGASLQFCKKVPICGEN